MNIETTKDALNYRAVAVRNSFEANSLKSIGFIEGKNLILVVDSFTAWQMLKVGRADITYANAPILELSDMNSSLFKRQGGGYRKIPVICGCEYKHRQKNYQ